MPHRAKIRRVARFAQAELKRRNGGAARGPEDDGLCVVHKAFGREVPCAEEACPFHDVPGTPGCAAIAWCPDVAEDPAKAAWFLERKDEARLNAER